MNTKLVTIGDDQAIVIDPSFVERLGLKEGDRVHVSVENGSLVITPVSPKASDSTFDQAMKRVISERGNMLRRLADS